MRPDGTGPGGSGSESVGADGTSRARTKTAPGDAAATEPAVAGAARDPGGDDWKQQALAEFRQWLDELPAAPAASPVAELEREQAPEVASCDLRDLFAELAALRQEVRLQNREQSRATRELAGAAARFGAAGRAPDTRDHDLTGVEERVSRAAENRCLLPVLDVRDSLVRGRDAAVRLRRASAKGGKGGKGRRKGARKRLRRMRQGIAGVIEGYELAVRRCDRMLARFGVRGVPAVGARFDARTMHAVDTRRVKRQEEGTVVEEYVSGFVRDGAVLRLAEVAVNRRSSTEKGAD